MARCEREFVSLEEFRDASKALIGLPLNHVWRGYGSAIFLEFGELLPWRIRDRTLREPVGEWTLGIEWSWRVEGKRRIWCGSWSKESLWPGVFSCLVHAQVASVSLAGRLPEIDLGLSNGLHVVSTMTADGDPQWALIRRTGNETVSWEVRCARICRVTSND
jgi:hypothetical protein